MTARFHSPSTRYFDESVDATGLAGMMRSWASSPPFPANGGHKVSQGMGGVFQEGRLQDNLKSYQDSLLSYQGNPGDGGQPINFGQFNNETAPNAAGGLVQPDNGGVSLSSWAQNQNHSGNSFAVPGGSIVMVPCKLMPANMMNSHQQNNGFYHESNRMDNFNRCDDTNFRGTPMCGQVGAMEATGLQGQPSFAHPQWRNDAMMNSRDDFNDGNGSRNMAFTWPAERGYGQMTNDSAYARRHPTARRARVPAFQQRMRRGHGAKGHPATPLEPPVPATDPLAVFVDLSCLKLA